MYKNIILILILFLAIVTIALSIKSSLVNESSTDTLCDHFPLSHISFISPNSSIFGGASKVIPYYKDLKKHPRSKAEQNVILIIEKLTGESFPTVHPPWLIYKNKHLELDGYSDKLKLAVEFSGPQHTKWYPNKEPYDKYYNRIKNDEAKLKICKKHGVNLIVIDKAIPRHNLYVYIRSRLYDVGILKTAPPDYIPPTIVKPDVNLQLHELSEKLQPKS